MLDPWIIEEIRRREDEQRQNERQPVVVEMPVHMPSVSEERDRERPEGDGMPRGVVVIDFSVS